LYVVIAEPPFEVGAVQVTVIELSDAATAVGSDICPGTERIVAPEVLMTEAVLVPAELIAETYATTNVPYVSEKGDDVRVDIGIMQ
jgi:hypothetical protein